MADSLEIESRVTRNLTVANECEIKSKLPFDKGYFKGKSDALQYIKELLEGKYDGK